MKAIWLTGLVGVCTLLGACATEPPKRWVAASPEATNLDKDRFECDRDVRLMRAADEENKPLPQGDLARAIAGSTANVLQDARMRECMAGRGWRQEVVTP